MLRSSTILFLALPLLGMAQSQLVLDTSSTQDYIVLTGAAASNGDRVLALRGAGGLMLWRATANGAPVWTREVDGFPGLQTAPGLHADAQNGIVVQGPLTQEAVALYPGEGLVDTLRLHTVLTRIAPNGNMDWRREVVVTFDYPQATMLFLEDMVMSALPDGFAVVAHVSGIEYDDIVVVKMDLQGQVQSSSSYRGVMQPMNSGVWTLTDVVMDQAGGLYLCGASPSFSGQTIFVTHLDQYGAPDWAKGWNYTNAPIADAAYGRAVPMPDGSVTIASRKTIPGHDYLSTIRVNQVGDLVDASFYTHPPSSVWKQVTLSRPNDGTMLMGLDSVVVALAEDGTVQAAAAMESSVLGEMRNTFVPGVMSGSLEGAVLFGVLNEVHVDLGFTYHKPAIRTVDPSAPGCHAVAVQVNRVVVPTELYQVLSHGTYVQQSPQVAMSTLSGTSVPREFIGTSDLCEAMIIAGLSDTTKPSARVLVNTVAQRGEPFMLSGTMPCKVNVYDAAGRFLVNDRAYGAGNGTIQTADWVPGMYWVRVSAMEGTAPSTQRVMLMP